MIEVMVWILLIGTHDGGLDTRLTFKSEKQCQHLLKEAEKTSIRYLRGSCIQANIYINAQQEAKK